MLTEGRDFEDISFEITDVQDCKDCYEPDGVCGLWVMLLFVEQMKPQMSMNAAKATIENLDQQLKE